MKSPETVVDHIVKIWNENFKGESEPEKYREMTDQLVIFDRLHQSNLQTVVFSFTDLSILYINQAATDFFETSAEEMAQAGAAYIISCFDKEQLQFATYSAELSARDLARSPPEDVLNSYTCYANWIINTRNGKTKRAFFRIFPIQLNDKGLPEIGMYLIYDVMPFLNGHTWWYRSSVGGTRFMHYHSDEKKLLRKDLLTEREKIVLRELSAGKSSKELGEKLHISNHTVDNHRRRMLAKTGAIDTSALIHIAKLTGII